MIKEGRLVEEMVENKQMWENLIILQYALEFKLMSMLCRVELCVFLVKCKGMIVFNE